MSKIDNVRGYDEKKKINSPKGIFGKSITNSYKSKDL